MDEKTKDTFRIVGTIVLSAIIIFASGYITGRNRRLANVSSASGQLEQRIDESLNTAGDILNRSDTAGAIANGLASSGSAVAEGLGTMQLSSQRLELFYSEVIRAVEADKEATRTFESIHNASTGATVDALDIAIQHSEQYEELISSLQRIIDDLNKDNQKSR